MRIYDITSFGGMIRDHVRTGAYAQALENCVRRDSVVLDMGTGVGIWAMLACRFGARKVYAVDPNDVIRVAQDMAADNGYADRIEFIQDMSTRISLPEQVDLIVTEMHGVLPMYEQNLASIIDARKRFLAPGGRIIPERETLWAAVVDAADAFDRLALPWRDNSYGLDMRRAMPLATNKWNRPGRKICSEHFLAEPKCWATLDYQVLESPDVAGKVTWTATRAGTGHGFVTWFDTLLADGVGFSNAPDAPELIFGHAFFPWPEPVSISTGDTISIAIFADLVGADYLWRWESKVLAQGHPEKVKAEFKQSTFFILTALPDELPESNGHLPALNMDGQIEKFILSLMDGRNSLESIAGRVAAEFPERFPGEQETLALVAELSQKFSSQNNQ